eukprot:12094175-Ditylum_brightwellii.AAC.1
MTSSNPTSPKQLQTQPVQPYKYPTQPHAIPNDDPNPTVTKHMPDPVIPVPTPPPRRLPRFSAPHVIPPKTVHFVAHTELLRHNWAHAVLHPTTGKVQTYEQLNNDPATKPIWSLAMCKELGRLAQGYKQYTEGTNTVFFLNKHAIQNIPKDCTITYACIVADYRPQKQDPNHVQITAGGNLINYPGD